MIKTITERLPQTQEWDGFQHNCLHVEHDHPNHLFLAERWNAREQHD